MLPHHRTLHGWVGAEFGRAAATQLLASHGWTVKRGGTDTCTRPGTGSSECGAGIKAGQPFTVKALFPSGDPGFAAMVFPATMGLMATLNSLARATGWTCIAIGGIQLVGGVRTEPGMNGDATVDSHVRFMGPVFAGYGLGWLDAATTSEPKLGRMRVLAGLMALGGVGRLATRVTMGRPHRFHDLLLTVELAAPVAVEVAARREHPRRSDEGRRSRNARRRSTGEPR